MSRVYRYKLCTSCNISHIYKLPPDMVRTSTMVFLPIVLHPQDHALVLDETDWRSVKNYKRETYRAVLEELVFSCVGFLILLLLFFLQSSCSPLFLPCGFFCFFFLFCERRYSYDS